MPLKQFMQKTLCVLYLIVKRLTPQVRLMYHTALDQGSIKVFSTHDSFTYVVTDKRLLLNFKEACEVKQMWDVCGEDQINRDLRRRLLEKSQKTALPMNNTSSEAMCVIQCLLPLLSNMKREIPAWSLIHSADNKGEWLNKCVLLCRQ